MPAPTSASEPDDPRLWRISGMSPKAIETARAAARRAGVPMGEWLAGLIRQVARREAEDRQKSTAER